jgi:catechol 2,3-dioxygenase-like lactoylglutathione lyase family enzyme
MKFRAARHTHILQPIIDFYTKIIGLKVLGDFQNHEGYDGVFIGEINENSTWHLEFTVSWQQPLHRPDVDDLLVFYPDKIEFENILKRIKEANYPTVQPHNPYWRRNGITLLDPDGYGVVIVKPTYLLEQ